MWRRLAGLLALLPGLWLASAQALGLGDIELRSRLNQRLAANVPVLGAEPSEIESLVVRLASPEDFARAGIERPEFLSSLEFTLAPTGDSVRVSSRQTVRDPLLNFIVEARWNGGRVLREYTVLLDPPADTAREAAASAVHSEAAAPAVTRPAAPAASRAGAVTSTYGPVLPSETLWSIATKLRPSAAITMDQVLLAIYRANPQAFEGGINGLLKGSKLKVPTAEDMASADALGARAEVTALRAQPAPSTRGVAAAVEKPALPPAAPASLAKRPEAAAESPKPEAAKPEAPKPEASKPEPAKPEPAKPEAAKPEPAKLEPAKPEIPSHEAAKPEPAHEPAAAAGADAQAAAAEPGAPAEHGKPAESAEPAGPAEPAEPAGSVPAEPAATAEAAAAPAEPTTGSAVEAAPEKPIEAAAPAAATPADGEWLQTLQWPLIAAALALLGGLIVLRRLRAVRAAARAATPPEPPRAPAAAIDVLLADTASRPDVPAARAEPRLEPAPVASAPEAEPAAPVVEPAPAPAAVPASVEAPATVSEPAPPPPPPPPITISQPPVIEEAQVIEALPLPPASELSDPLTEADFHIAYGLYDEAAQMLRDAAEAEPDRVELRSKLADTYFAAGKAEAFLETAAGLRGQVSRGEWQRITDMGRSLCPQATLFADAASPPMEAAAPVQTAYQAPERRDSLADISLIDFDLDAELADTAPTPPATFNADPGWDPEAPLSNPAPTQEASAGAPVFDLAMAETAREALAPMPEPLADLMPEPLIEPALEPAADPLPELSLQTLPEPAPMPEPAPEPAPLPTQVAEAVPPPAAIDAPAAPAFDDSLTEAAFDIDAHMPADAADADSAFSIGDEADTKLDLARAYADMGDEDAARSLLAEVIASGSEHQRREAESLSQRLTG